MRASHRGAFGALARRACIGGALALGVGSVGCGSSDSGSSGGAADASVRSMFAAPASLDDLAEGAFFDHPWPSDARLDADGTPHFAGYPNPRALPIIADYVSAVESMVHGFSPVASGFLRFTGPLDPSSLPADVPASTKAGATVELIDVDPKSPDVGTRRPLTVYWRDEAGVYWPEHTLAFMPALGAPMRASTRYAIVVTDGVRAADGGPVKRAPELDEVLGLAAPSAPTKPIHDAWADAIAAIENAGIAKSHIVHLSVFTTDDPSAELYAVRDDVRANEPPPNVDDASWQVKEKTANYQVFEGTYGPSPDYQEGKIPFTHFGDGGGFAFDAGKPVKQRDFDLRFVLGVPDQTKCPMPAGGYPIVMHAHGTGGDYRSHFRSGTAEYLATKCIASMGIDQIFHGTRPGAPPPGPEQETNEELLFFNFQNPVAARTNGRQAAIDEVQRARLVTESHMQVPASVNPNGTAIAFDPKKVMFFGHSQGGVNGPLFLAADDGALGGVLSGSGSMIALSLIEKTEPVDIRSLVINVFLGLHPGESDEVNPLHPELSLAQTIVDAEDPVSYVARLARDPRPGFAPKSIYQTEGVDPDGTGDHYTPPNCIEVQSVVTGLPPQDPMIHPFDEDAWAGITALTIAAGGLSGNLADGLASGVLAQWPASQASDGHFVVFDIPAAKEQSAQFLRNLADDPKGNVPPPSP